MTLRYCHPIPVASTENNKNLIEKETITRPLVVLFAWMLAKDKHIEKYRNLYFQRGFDVLTVKTEPFELLLPERGSQRVARNVLTFLNDAIKQYPKIIIHAFSVGAYQFGEVLVQMEKKENGSLRKTMQNAIQGMIFDSAADLEAIPNGLSRAVTENPILRFIYRNAITTHMRLFYNIATKHYLASSKAFHNNILRCPALLLLSHDDVVGNPAANQKVMNQWVKNGIEVHWKCWGSSSHVGHLIKYPKEYESQVNNFLKRIQIIQ
jgi:hypothetical protein